MGGAALHAREIERGGRKGRRVGRLERDTPVEILLVEDNPPTRGSPPKL